MHRFGLLDHGVRALLGLGPELWFSFVGPTEHNTPLCIRQLQTTMIVHIFRIGNGSEP